MRCVYLILSVNAPSPTWPLALLPTKAGRSSFFFMAFTKKLVLGHLTFPALGNITGSDRQTRLQPCERDHRLLGSSPPPGRVPRRPGESLLVSSNTPQQETPQGVQVNGQDGSFL